MDSESDRRVLRFALQSQARVLLPDQRVAWCMRRVGYDQVAGKSFTSIKVMWSDLVQRAHYKNLMVCGSVWTCPVCSAKISERRRVELTQAIDRNDDLKIILVGYTLQHAIEDSLKSSLDALLDALKKMRMGRRWIEFKNDYGLVGSVRSLETTYGVNGHHPHSHMLYFFDGTKSLIGAPSAAKSLYLDALNRCGRDASWVHGCDWRSADKDVADYVAKFGCEPKDLKRPGKWTVEHEITKSISKMARGDDGKTPLELLRLAMLGNKQALMIWKEFARVFKGRKQLVWSHGLRRRLGMGSDQTDEQIAKREDEKARMLAMLGLHQWHVILAQDARAEIINLLNESLGDVQRLKNFLREIGAD